MERITWAEFGVLAAGLAEQLAPAQIDLVIGIARAGLFPATAVACALRCDLTPVRVTRRVADEVVYTHPIWKVDVPAEVAGRTVAVVDEMADTGETLRLVAARVLAQGAARVVTASLFAHTWAEPMPAVVARVTDALVIFPWDERVYVNGAWQQHPELAAALAMQAAHAVGSANPRASAFVCIFELTPCLY